MEAPLFVGVDVGTGSARAGLFDQTGTLLASHKTPFPMWREGGDIVEQSSAAIWTAVCASVRQAVAGTDTARVAGIGFDAACSLVVLDRAGQPMAIGPSGDPSRNVIVWMDHRATDQAERINAMGHPVLDYVGGRISPEMQTPKLLWLAEIMPDAFARAGHFLDLADFLTWAATGSLARSACTVTCKWTYLAHEGRWDPGYFHQIGLGALAEEDFTRIGQKIVDPGTPLGAGLTPEAAQAMGLRPGTPVGAGLIDAHAGGVGTVGAARDAGPEAVMAYVFGTSACTMASSPRPHFVPGVWGPYHSAMIPGLWLSEGGQSAAGEAIAQIIATHPASAGIRTGGGSVQDHLLSRLAALCPDVSQAVDLAGSRMVVPDFLGNRAPHADPHAGAVLSGLGMDRAEDDLLAFYVAGLYGIGYGLRQIIEVQAARGVAPRLIAISGGAGASDAVKQLLADASGLPVMDTDCPEPVLLGAAMLGAVTSGHAATLGQAMAAMSRERARFHPAGGRIAALHDRRARAFALLQQADRVARGLPEAASG